MLCKAALLSLALLGCELEPEPSPPKTTPPIDAILKQATLQYRADHLDDAIAACRAGLERDSTAVALYNLLATAYVGQGRYALAIEALQQALRFDASYAIAHVNLGGIYTKLGQYARAEESLLRAFEIEPDHSAACRRLGEVYLGTNRFAVAAQYLGRALKLLPASATLHFYLGQALEGSGDLQLALAHYDSSTRLDIGFAKAHYRVASVGARLGHTARADSAMQRFQYLQQIGNGDPDALKELQKLRADVMNLPEDHLAHYRLGLFFAAQGYGEEALNKLVRASQLAPDQPYLLNRIGELYQEQSRPAAALDYFRQVLRLAPQHRDALRNAGRAAETLNQYRAAVDFHCQAVGLQPREPTGWYELGRALKGAGRADEAQQILRIGLGFVQGDSMARQPFDQQLAALAAEAAAQSPPGSTMRNR